MELTAGGNADSSEDQSEDPGNNSVDRLTDATKWLFERSLSNRDYLDSLVKGSLLFLRELSELREAYNIPMVEIEKGAERLLSGDLTPLVDDLSDADRKKVQLLVDAIRSLSFKQLLDLTGKVDSVS